MITLPHTLADWNTPNFRETLKREIEALDKHLLPLQAGMSMSNQVSERPIQAMVLSERDSGACIHVNVGIFFSGVIAGCNCADDPTPVDEQNEYCVIQLEIDKQTAATQINLIPD